MKSSSINLSEYQISKDAKTGFSQAKNKKTGIRLLIDFYLSTNKELQLYINDNFDLFNHDLPTIVKIIGISFGLYVT